MNNTHIKTKMGVPNITVPIGTARELAPSEILAADSTDYLLGGILTLRNGRIDKHRQRRVPRTAVLCRRAGRRMLERQRQHREVEVRQRVLAGLQPEVRRQQQAVRRGLRIGEQPNELPGLLQREHGV